MSGADEEFAGRLRERITIERRGEARDTLGAAEGEWVPVAESWAAIAPERFGAAIEGEAASAAGRYRVTLRAGAAARIGDRIGWRGCWLRVTTAGFDPALPDRMILQTEEMR